MQPHEERVAAEYTELLLRKKKLSDFIGGNPQWYLLSNHEKSLLLEQEEVMGDYASILKQRIELFSKETE